MRSLLLFFFAASSLLAFGQESLNGRWEGFSQQTGKAERFAYVVELEQQGNDFSGTAFSKSPDGSMTARFALIGKMDGDTLLLQEWRQIEPSAPRWCMKRCKLLLHNEGGMQVLRGTWKADGCSDGILEIRLGTGTGAQHLSSDFSGQWTGHLGQSDRDYGFYFELNLQADGTGYSLIESEAQGGLARMDLRWNYNPGKQELQFQELQSSYRSDANWPWCIKQASLTLEQDDAVRRLQGAWSGHIEGHSGPRGACAPGQLMLEQVMPKTRQLASLSQELDAYENNQERVVRMGRVVQVSKPELKIRVWDNGAEDGDVLTLYLNGELLLNEFRVTKRKHTIIVRLKQAENVLIMHADDLGSISPNTVAISVDDGQKEQTLIVSSNLKESGAVLVRWFNIE